ncbi:HlyD family efflux transporter periplasmic adaptor subunit [Shewanella sp. Scap07]|uniref:efflux RND transporter periplasmic adaptor subunit n=1 Tax=Shewanella sp. Scap07 TaxID=2589987 RepID=UPI0015BC6E46|nr:efflux RND transporter periplasmic adaptor subunit [Shewanella sp. Scap07]QLE84031.1 HlyD family efflux transporter periplasmic adaptor subunit [Shewanella sp. Scap07]
MNIRLLNTRTILYSSLAFALAITGMTYAFASGEHQHQQSHEDTHHDDHDKHGDSHDGHGDEHGDHHDEHEEGQVHISDSQIAASGISVSTAQAGTLAQTITLYGKTVIAAENQSLVQARFSGLITQLNVSVGDTVTAGQVIAEVESNSSFKRYAVKAPISGQVVARHANAGELTQATGLVSIVNEQQLWAELQAFPGQFSQLSQGQSVRLTSQDGQYISSAIGAIITPLESQPFTVVRVKLENNTQQWHAGMLLAGEVVLSQQTVAVRLDRRALQEMEGQQVIFVKNGEGFEKRVVTIGATDNRYAEVLSGLTAGEAYAVNKSFLLKADLEKSSAAHVH